MKTISVATLLLLTTILFYVQKANCKTQIDNVTITSTGNESSLDIKGTLKLSGSSTGAVGFTVPNEAGSTIYTLPANDGSSGQILTTNGSGALTWTTIGRTNGTNGQVLSTNGAGTLTWATIHRTSCPVGTNLIGTPASAEAFCISSAQEVATTWLGAVTNCYNKSPKAHLCSAGEWVMSCVAGNSGANNMTGHWEWVSDSGSNYGRIIGLAGCDSFNGATVEAKYASRCCFR